MTSTFLPASVFCATGSVRYSAPSFGSVVAAGALTAKAHRAAAHSRFRIARMDGFLLFLVAYDGDVDTAVEQFRARLVHCLELAVGTDAHPVQHAAVVAAVAD